MQSSNMMYIVGKQTSECVSQMKKVVCKVYKGAVLPVKVLVLIVKDCYLHLYVCTTVHLNPLTIL